MQKSLEKAQMVDTLNRRLSKRRSLHELEKQNIVETEVSLKEKKD